MIPGSGRSLGEGVGYPFQYSLASLVAQTMWETWVRSLGWEDPLGWVYPLEKGMAAHSSILGWRIPMDKKPGCLQSTGSQRVGHK